MLGKGVGLVELVGKARKRELARRHIQDWIFDEKVVPLEIVELRTWADECCWAAAKIADEVMRLCLEGDYQRALKVCFLTDAYRVPDTGYYLDILAKVPAWKAFHEAVTLAERIDSFLVVMECSGSSAPLARDCRHELDLLCVLADLCQDAGRLQVAEDARHLHALACSLYRG
jgi:hypothetical protein